MVEGVAGVQGGVVTTAARLGGRYADGSRRVAKLRWVEGGVDMQDGVDQLAVCLQLLGEWRGVV